MSQFTGREACNGPRGPFSDRTTRAEMRDARALLHGTVRKTRPAVASAAQPRFAKRRAISFPQLDPQRLLLLAGDPIAPAFLRGMESPTNTAAGNAGRRDPVQLPNTRCPRDQ